MVLDLVAGERVHCTFTNTKLGTVVIKKATAPAGGQGFSFSGALGDFSLNDGDDKLVANLRPGTYVVTEDDPAGSGFKLSGLSCTDSVKGGKKSAGDVATRAATVRLDAGEVVTCQFTNSQDDTITVEKVTIPASSDSFGFGGTLGVFSLANGQIQSFTGLGQGQYTISEDDPSAAGYTLTDISCVDSATGQTFSGDLNSRSVDLDLVPGERVHCIFTNEKAPEPGAVRLTESFAVSRVAEGQLTGEGSRACYWVTLKTDPGVGQVVVTIGPPANSQVRVNKIVGGSQRRQLEQPEHGRPLQLRLCACGG